MAALGPAFLLQLPRPKPPPLPPVPRLEFRGSHTSFYLPRSLNSFLQQPVTQLSAKPVDVTVLLPAVWAKQHLRQKLNVTTRFGTTPNRNAQPRRFTGRDPSPSALSRAVGGSRPDFGFRPGECR